MSDLRRLLGLEDCFEGFEVDPTRVDMQGWNSRHPFFDVAISLVKPSLIIELGVWKGMSSIHMAKLLKAKKLPGQILSIDTWLGSSNHLAISGRRSELMPEFGYPTVYTTFLSNVVSSGHHDRIVPLAMDGNSAAYALKRLQIKAGVIHIDASHEYGAALSDFRTYWPLLADDGILIADDYGSWPGVTRALLEFAAEQDRPVFTSMGKALLPKHPTMGFEMQFVKRKDYKRSATPSEA